MRILPTGLHKDNLGSFKSLPSRSVIIAVIAAFLISALVINVDAQYGSTAEEHAKGRRLAEQGDPEWQYFSGIRACYHQDYNDPKYPDYAAAIKWFRMAADQGYVPAMNNLGSLLVFGKLFYCSGPRDYQQGIKWFRAAADKDDGFAMYNLGRVYHYAYGLPQDLHEAMRWYQKAAEKGVGCAMYKIGVMYRDGEGVPKDTEKAGYWFYKAARAGDGDARKELERVGIKVPKREDTR